MRKYLILGSLLLVTVNVNAESGHGYKVTAEKITSTPGFNFKVESHVKKNNLQPMSASAKASAPNRDGKVGSYSQIDGYHDITLINRTNVSQSYSYAYTLDCADAHGSYTRNITLTPGGTYSTSDHSFGTVQKSASGSFRITATTKVSGESSSSDAGTGTLTIRK